MRSRFYTNRVFTGMRILGISWVLFFWGAEALGQPEAEGETVDPKAQVFEVSTTFTPGFGRDWAQATIELMQSHVIDWQNDPQMFMPRSDPGGNRNHFAVLYILVGLGVFSVSFCVLGIAARWVADVGRIRKYRSDVRKISVYWWMGRFTIFFLCLLLVAPWLRGMLRRSTNPELEAEGPPSPGRMPTTIAFNDPREASPENIDRCLVSYSDRSPGARRLAMNIQHLLSKHGLGDIALRSVRVKEPLPAQHSQAISLQLYGHARFDLNVQHPADGPAEPMIARFREELPRLNVTSTSVDADIPGCVVRYPESNPLAVLAAQHMHSVLQAHGFDPTMLGELDERKPCVLIISLPPLSEVKLVLHHLPTQDLADLKLRLNQEDIAVTLRPSTTPPLAGGVLYYPAGEGGLKAMAAREKADQILQLTYQQGFLGNTATPSWGVPMARAEQEVFELSVVPIGEARDVDIFCDQAFNRKLRPIVLQKLRSDQYKVKVRFEATDRNPPTDPGVIRYADAGERGHAERLQAVLSEIVGLVNIQLAEAEEPQLERMSVWLSYDRNGAFHRFVDTLVKSLGTTTRDSIRTFYSEQGWAEDRIARRHEYGSSCLKLLPFQETDFTDDWIRRYIRPGTWRLETLRLQKEDVGGWCSVIPATRVMITALTASGFKIDSVPADHIVDTAIPERFNVELVGGSEEIRSLLSRYDARVDDGVMPPGATDRSIYFPENSEGGLGIARIAQAILAEDERYFSLKSYPNQGGDTKVYIVVSTGREDSRE